MTVIKAAAVQLSPVLYSREGTVDKVIRQILALGRQGVQFATFPETVVPYYPYFSFVQPPYRMAAEHHTPARTGGHRPVGRHPGHRRGLQAGGAGGVHRRQRARRRHALQRAAPVRRRRQPDPASPQDLPDLPRAHGLGAGRRLRAAGRRQRGRAHRLAGVLGALQPAGPLRPDGRRRADPLGDVPRLVRGRPVRPADRGQHPPARPGVRLLRRQRHRLAGRRPAGPDHAGHRLRRSARSRAAASPRSSPRRAN